MSRSGFAAAPSGGGGKRRHYPAAGRPGSTGALPAAVEGRGAFARNGTLRSRVQFAGRDHPHRGAAPVGPSSRNSGTAPCAATLRRTRTGRAANRNDGRAVRRGHFRASSGPAPPSGFHCLLPTVPGAGRPPRAARSRAFDRCHRAFPSASLPFGGALPQDAGPVPRRPARQSERSAPQPSSLCEFAARLF